MGIDIRLERENGETLEWASEPLPKILQSCDSTEFPLSSFIDPFGDTVFNSLQATALLHEWDILTSRAAEPDRRVMEEEARLIEKCRDGVHLYIRFVGD